MYKNHAALFLNPYGLNFIAGDIKHDFSSFKERTRQANPLILMDLLTMDKLLVPGSPHLPDHHGEHPEHGTVHLARLGSHHELFLTCGQTVPVLKSSWVQRPLAIHSMGFLFVFVFCFHNENEYVNCTANRPIKLANPALFDCRAQKSAKSTLHIDITFIRSLNDNISIKTLRLL